MTTAQCYWGLLSCDEISLKTPVSGICSAPRDHGDIGREPKKRSSYTQVVYDLKIVYI